MSCHFVGASYLLSLAFLCALSAGAESRFAKTHSRSQYVHWIDLYDAHNHKIDPTDPNASPYSPVKTCGRCHDYKAISHGYHFNATDKRAAPGRPGEPWIWTDTRTGTQIPLSYRGWKGTYTPKELGISRWDFVLKFGHHLPGGGPGEPPAEADGEPDAEAAESQPANASPENAAEASAEDGGRWALSGELSIDCLMCHTGGGYSPEIWWEQVGDQNFAWAATAALGLGHVEGEVKRLPDDFDPAAVAENSRYKLPTTTYAPLRINGEKKVFFDIVRKPRDNACYYCHTTRFAGEDAAPEWTYDEDVHLRAGISCSDCHRNGIGHHTVRGFEGEANPSGQPVATLSCRGCHMGDEADGGRFGAPKPLHRGLPPLHFEKLSCTACHSGPRPSKQTVRVQTALAHGLGLPSHEAGDIPPGIVTPVFLRDGDGGPVYPHRMTWPAFWGTTKDNEVTPLNPQKAYETLRRTLRVRRGETFTQAVTKVKWSAQDKAGVLGKDRAHAAESELTEEEKGKLAELEKSKGIEAWRGKLAEALVAIKQVAAEQGAEPVYVSGGKAYRLAEDGSAIQFDHSAAKPYAWKLAHDVRPARWSLGAGGCSDCHAAGAPIFEGKVAAIGPAPDDAPVTQAMYELAQFDKTKLDAWNRSFQGRTAFKWLGFTSSGAVGVILLMYLSLGLNELAGMIGRK